MGMLEMKVGQVAGMINRGSRNPVIQTIAERLTLKALRKRRHQESSAILGELHEWAQETIDYKAQQGDKDHFQDPLETLQLREGDCEDFTIILGSMTTYLGIPTIMRVVSKDNKNWRHIYAVAGLPSGNPRYWIPLDASARSKPMGWQNTKSYRYYKDFLVT